MLKEKKKEKVINILRLMSDNIIRKCFIVKKLLLVSL